MRIIYFLPFLSQFGGLERTLADKANWLVENGHEVLFVTYEHEGRIIYALHSAVRHIDLDCHFFAVYRYPVYLRLLEIIKLKLKFRRNMKEVISQFCPDVIVITIPNTENFIMDVFAVAKGIPEVVESHLAFGRKVIKRGLTETLFYHIQNPLRAVQKADLLISLTQGDATCWRSAHVGNVKVIPNLVTAYNPLMKNVQKICNRVIAVGRFAPQKRFDRLLEAYSLLADKYPSWRLDIFGDGEEKTYLEDLIASKGIQDCVHLTPPTKDIYNEFQCSQFFVLSSDFEGFGLVIVEAMACGIPVVSTDCPYGPSEIIEDGKTGLLAKMDVQDLADKMEWMITHEEERKAMGARAHQAAARYRKEVVMPEWEKAYLSVIGKSK